MKHFYHVDVIYVNISRCCECYASLIHRLIVTMIWIWSVCLYWVGDVSLDSCHEFVCLSLQHPLSWLTFDLQHELKGFLLPHLWHFLPNAGHSLYACVKLHLLHILSVLCLLVLPLCELLAPFELPFSTAFFTMFETFDHIKSHWLGNSSIGLVMIKVFHHHLMFPGILK